MTNLNGFDLNLLRVLDALLREKSTVRAAERIVLSQPAVSAALGRLRHGLDDELFFRRGQGLEATEFARSLEEPLQAIMADLAKLLAGPAEFDPARSTASFRISGSEAIFFNTCPIGVVLRFSRISSIIASSSGKDVF